jgi:hypothetical protein
VLPLPDGTRAAVVGELARTPRFQGGGSSRVNPTHVDIPLDALRALAGERGSEVTFASGCPLDRSANEGSLRGEAVDAARAADRGSRGDGSRPRSALTPVRCGRLRACPRSASPRTRPPTSC